MLSFNLDSKQSAEKLIQLCERYRGCAEIDLICGRQVVDGRSILGVVSLLGHFVTIDIISDDYSVIDRFAEELKLIS